jgi:hypothetical protein
MPRANKKDLRQAELDTITDLTKESKGKRAEALIRWSDVDLLNPKIEITLNRDTVKKQLRRRVKELFRGHEYTNADRLRAFFPSTSANYISSVRNAGAIGEILRHPTLLDGLRKAGGYLKMQDLKSEEIESEDEVIRGSMNFEEFNDAFAVLWFRMLDIAASEESGESNIVEPVALPEALKIRVITKGPPFTQTVLRALQRKMWGILHKHQAFQLIGEPVTSKYILDRLGTRLGEREGYLSGDYEAATNNLESWVSNEIAEAICDEMKIHGLERGMFRRNLTENWIDDGEGNLTLQRTGQLMGSITSFPVLCIANAVVSAWAYELDSKKLTKLQDWPGMINGDDIAMRCTEEGVSAWRQISSFIGLKESVGKTYYSREFVNINSTNFQRSEDELTEFLDKRKDGIWVTRYNPFSETKYVNMGLMNGLKRSGQSMGLRDQSDPHDNIGTRYRELMRTVPPSMKETVHKNFINRHRELLTATHLPWYVPEWIGGLGMIGFQEPSELDLRIARMILMNWKRTRPISLSHGTTNWKTWQLAEARAPKPFYIEQKNKGTELYNRIVGQKCIDLLFDSSIQLNELKQEVTSGRKVSAAIRHNAKLWSPKTYGNHLCAPLSYDDLIFKPKYSSYVNVIEVQSPRQDLD